MFSDDVEEPNHFDFPCSNSEQPNKYSERWAKDQWSFLLLQSRLLAVEDDLCDLEYSYPEYRGWIYWGLVFDREHLIWKIAQLEASL